jgi:hypothetical protein
MKPEQLEMRLRRAVQMLKDRAGYLKKAAAYFAKESIETRLHREAPGAGRAGWLCGRSVSPGFYVADAASQSTQSYR